MNSGEAVVPLRVAPFLLGYMGNSLKSENLETSNPLNVSYAEKTAGKS